METPKMRPATIIAVTSEDPRHEAVRRRATAIARDAQSTVILWARDASLSALESPLPTDWSGDGEEEQFGDRLGPDDLVAAGREPLARQVSELRTAGIDAWGWLPETADAEHLTAYAADQGAELVLVSAGDEDLVADLHIGDAHDPEGPNARRARVEAVPT